MDIYFSLCIFTQYYFMCGIAQIIMIWVKRCFYLSAQNLSPYLWCSLEGGHFCTYKLTWLFKLNSF